MMRNNRTANSARGHPFRVANQLVALDDVIAGVKFRRWDAMSSDYQFPRSDSIVVVRDYHCRLPLHVPPQSPPIPFRIKI